jgi:two-component system, chemotaxis family, CheB/CheR fusion protein
MLDFMATPPQNQSVTDTPHNDSLPTPLLIIGLGASAGGVKVLQDFFDAMPPDSGMAFVVVMHLSPDHQSSLPMILQQRTTMPVLMVTEGMSLEADHVYVIPPNTHLSLDGGRLHLLQPQQPAGRRIAIDLFFRSLSVNYGPRAVAIILTGTDSDGVIGIKHIKEQGGLTIAQDPQEAEFDSMPRTAIETGMVDWILPLAQIPPQLMELIHNERRMHIPPEQIPQANEEQTKDTNSGGPVVSQQTPSLTDEAALIEVLRFLRGQTGHDFAHYKRATILRRVARRLQVNLLENISSYLDFLRTHPAEGTALLHDLLISVTNYFRDRDAFAVLESHIPQLFADKKPSDQVRVWVAGCATGEEAYSVAMLLQEHASKLDTPPTIQVFATDLDDEAIHAARAGLYPVTIEADVSPERLRRFFHKDQGKYRIKKEIRELVLFSTHDVLRDSPFSRLDLITCRNLLIYLKREAQEGIFDIFHFALRPGGLLFLGGSESLNDSHNLFAPLEKRYRLYVRRNVTHANWQIPMLPVPSLPTRLMSNQGLARSPLTGSHPMTALESASMTAAQTQVERRNVLFGDLHLTLLERFAPPSMVINDNHDIVHLTDTAGQFLHFTGGEISTNLLKLVDRALRVDLRNALFRAAKEQADITVSRVPITMNGVPRLINLHVRPVRQGDDAEGFMLVVFELLNEINDAPEQTPTGSETMEAHLDAENQHLKEQLTTTIEQYEALLEEIRASNEELQAMNEELRSATEELETSKEELQSINEELTTVNQELKSNVEELSRMNSDLQNLMASTEIGTIFLDRQLRIKRFTPPAQALFNLISSDIGRPLSDLTHRLNYGGLTDDANRVLSDLRMIEREVSSNGHWFLTRILPYRTLDDRIDGVVLAFVDITERKRIEAERLELEREATLLKERNRMAQELHDTLAQGFTAIKLQLDVAEDSLPNDIHRVQTTLHRARSIARNSLQEARRSIRALRSETLETDGLAKALEEMIVGATQGTPTQVKWNLEGTEYRLPDDVESEIFRVGQEALTNALRHANANQIEVTLTYRDDEVCLCIKDDGQGFDPQATGGGFGLRGMRERVEAIGGAMDLSTGPGKGTEIRVHQPNAG